MSFGQKFKELRLKRKMTLRKFCKTFNLDPSNISKIERNIFVPDKQDIIEKYAIYLNLDKNQKEYQDFLDLAAIQKGKIPKDIAEDEEILKKLPAFFRSLRNDENPEELLKNLKDIINEDE